MASFKKSQAALEFIMTYGWAIMVIGQKFSGDLNITYTNADTGISHVAQGTITTKVQSSS